MEEDDLAAVVEDQRPSLPRPRRRRDEEIAVRGPVGAEDSHDGRSEIRTREEVVDRPVRDSRTCRDSFLFLPAGRSSNW